MWVYKKTEKNLWTVGFYSPDGKWNADSDYNSSEEAAKRVTLLNGGTTIEINYEKQIAQTILDAHKLHEESYYVCFDDDSGTGDYKLDWEECFIEASKKNNLSDNIWSLLCLANHWSNDIQLWAEDVLANKNILEECNKENDNTEIKHPICPLNIYFEGDENICNSDLCDFDCELKSCSESCKIKIENKNEQILVSKELAKEFIGYANNEPSCNSGTHIVDRLSEHIEKQFDNKSINCNCNNIQITIDMFLSKHEQTMLGINPDDVQHRRDIDQILCRILEDYNRLKSIEKEYRYLCDQIMKIKTN